MEYGMAIGAAVATAALGTASAIGNYNQAKSSARATKKKAEQEIEKRKEEILKLASTQKVSYVQAGVELEGTPQAVIQDTYNTGVADVNAIKSSYQQAIKNALTTARAGLIGGIAQSGMSAVSMYSGLGGEFGGDASGVEDMSGQSSGWNPAIEPPSRKPSI